MHRALVFLVRWGVAAAGPEGRTCLAGEQCAAPDAAHDDVRQHYWPHAFGNVGSYGVSPHAGPGNLSAAARWSWRHPRGRYAEEAFGVVIDGDQHFYVTTTNGLFKIDPDGQIAWVYPCESTASAALLGGRVFGSDKSGRIFGVDTASGRELWSVSNESITGGSIGVDSHAVGAHQGVVVACTHSPHGHGGSRVTAVNSTDGSLLWQFRTHSQLWVFAPLFTEDGTVVFQDQIGRVYRMGLTDGRLIWKTGYEGAWAETWVDGNPMLANGVVYAVHLSVPLHRFHVQAPGDLRAYDLSDGRLRWQHDFSLPVNSQPLVGLLAGGGRPSVVMPVGGQPPGYDRRCIYVTALSFGIFLAWPMGRLFGPVLAILYGCLRGRAWWCSKTTIPKLLACVLLVYALEYLRQVAIFVRRFPFPAHTSGPPPAQLWALDAESGTAQWSWNLPVMSRGMAAGGCELLLYSNLMGGPSRSSIPTPYGTGAIDADGVIYIPYQDGRIYAVADGDGDGIIDPDAEVSVASVGAAFNMEGVALAPGVLAVTTIDGSLHVFKRSPSQTR